MAFAPFATFCSPGPGPGSSPSPGPSSSLSPGPCPGPGPSPGPGSSPAPPLWLPGSSLSSHLFAPSSAPFLWLSPDYHSNTGLHCTVD